MDTFTFQPRKPFRRRPRAEAPPSPVALTLVAATYDEVDGLLFVTFDRPIDVSGFVGALVVVRDGAFNATAYVGTSPGFIENPTTIRVALAPAGPYAGAAIDMTATALTGIVAVDDGGTWAGTGGVLVLPWP